MPDTAASLCRLLLECLERYHAIRAHLEQLTERAPAESISDLHDHLSSLIHENFVRQTELTRLREVPRYLEGIEVRVRKLATAANKDLKRLRRLRPLRNSILQALADPSSLDDADTLAFRWALEELRIAMFAQETGAESRMSLEGVQARWQRHRSRLDDDLSGQIDSGHFGA
jgi:ATP-dependent helicase HrpA